MSKRKEAKVTMRVRRKGYQRFLQDFGEELAKISDGKLYERTLSSGEKMLVLKTKKGKRKKKS